MIALGVLACLLLGSTVGLGNGLIVRLGGINAVITTIATLSVVQGIALIARPTPAGVISQELTALLKLRIGMVPWSALLLLGLALLGDFWLYHSRSGLEARATGFSEQAAQRNGVKVTWVYLRACLLSGLLAALAGLFLAAQVSVGHPTAGEHFALSSIAAAVLGGAALTGGRGSFLGALFAALFFTLMTNLMSLLGLSSATGMIASGAMTLLAIFLYSGTGAFAHLPGRICRVRART